MTPRISIVIPTRDGAATLPAVLDAIGRQRVDASFEIVAIDSGSTDGTLDLLRVRVDRLIEIPARAFDHGLTRNAGIEAARGDVIVLLVQDAIPATDRWLDALTAPLFADTSLAGTFARQQPRADASALTRYYLSRWAAASNVPSTSTVASRSAFDALAPVDRFRACIFDNVCSCIRRSVWADRPFRSTPIGEDVEWAQEVLLAGHRLAYVPEAVVLHSHDRSARYEFNRTRVLHGRLFALFGLRTIPSVAALARAIASSLALHSRCARAEPPGRRAAAFRRGVGLAFAWPLGQYPGRATTDVGEGFSPAAATRCRAGLQPCHRSRSTEIEHAQDV